MSDLAEIATICALDGGIEVVAVVDESCGKSKFVGIQVFASFDKLTMPFDAVVITALQNAGDILRDARERDGADRVFVPPLLGLSEPVSRVEAS